MSDKGFYDVPSTPAAPPTDPGQLIAPSAPSSWPTIVGIIAIVFGAFGIMGGIWGAVSSYFAEYMMRGVPASQQAAFVDSTQETIVFTAIGGILGAAAAILLLVAGISLSKRRPGAPKLCKTWAVIKMLVVVVTSVLGAMVQQSTFEAMDQQGGNVFAGMSGIVIVVVAVITGLMWGWALPVFMLIWFSRRKIKEEVAGWE